MLDRERDLIEAKEHFTAMYNEWSDLLEETKASKGIYNKENKEKAIKNCESKMAKYDKSLQGAIEEYDNYLLNGSKGRVNYGD